MKKMTAMLLSLTMCLSLLIPVKSAFIPDSGASTDPGNLIQPIMQLPELIGELPVD